jgi:hypothetical protein
MSKIVPISGHFENAQAFLHHIAEVVGPKFSVLVFTFDNSIEDMPMGFGQIHCKQSHVALAGAECLKIAAMDRSGV